VTIAARSGDYLRGRITPAIALRVVLPLAVLSFAVAVALALAFFPALHDLRHRWVSALASPRHNRSGYYYFGAGLTALSLLLIPIPGYLSRRMAFSGGVRRAGVLLLGAGIAGLFLLGLETTVLQHYGRVRGMHRLLTAVTISGLTLGFFCFAALSMSRPAATHSRRWPSLLACVVLCAPGVGAGLMHVFLAFGSEGMGWATSRQVRQAVPFFRTLFFWEWMAVLSLFVGGYLCVWAASRHGDPSSESEPGSIAPASRPTSRASRAS
jgi:hypothetical protein